MWRRARSHLPKPLLPHRMLMRQLLGGLQTHMLLCAARMLWVLWGIQIQSLNFHSGSLATSHTPIEFYVPSQLSAMCQIGHLIFDALHTQYHCGILSSFTECQYKQMCVCFTLSVSGIFLHISVHPPVQSVQSIHPKTLNHIPRLSVLLNPQVAGMSVTCTLLVADLGGCEQLKKSGAQGERVQVCQQGSFTQPKHFIQAGVTPPDTHPGGEGVWI